MNNPGVVAERKLVNAHANLKRENKKLRAELDAAEAGNKDRDYDLALAGKALQRDRERLARAEEALRLVQKRLPTVFVVDSMSDTIKKNLLTVVHEALPDKPGGE